jgi:hypothetical protein
MIHTKDFSQKPIYTPDGVDYLYTEITIVVQAVINSNLLPAIMGENTVNIMNRIRSCLLCVRKQLIFSIDDNELVHSPANGELCDWHFGPKPNYCNITQITGSETMLIDYSVTTNVKECCNAGTAGGNVPANDVQSNQPYLSNRWAESVAIDESFYTTRTRRGVLYFKTNGTAGPVSANPDDYRHVICPPLIKGFVRQRSTYAIDEGNWTLAYEFTDKEEYHVPPVPATKFEMDHQIISNMGAIHFQEVSIRLWGAKTTKKKDLIMLAVQMLQSRLKISRTAIVKTATISDKSHENYVDLRARLMVTAKQNNTFGFNALFNNDYLDKLFGEPGDQRPPDPGTRGTAMLKIIGPAMNDACLCAGKSMNSPDDGVKGNELPPGGAIPPAVVFAADLPPFGTVVPLDQGELANKIITDYKIDVNYITFNHIAQMPVAGGSKVAAFAVVANPTVKKVVDFTVESIGEKAHIPDPENGNPNEVLENTQIMPAAADVGPNGENINRLTGRYTYAVVDPSKVVYSGGSLPYVTTGKDAATYKKQHFEQGLI